MTQFIAYYRVSTARQGRSGLGLEAQQAEIEAYVDGRGEIISQFTEIESGKVNSRPELAAALAQCKATGSTLIIAKLDRLARKVAFVANLMEAGVPFIVANQPNADPFRLHIEAAINEDEGRKISERTQAALRAARERGVKLGFAAPSRLQGQRMASEAGVRGNIERAERHAAKVRPIIRTIQAAGAITLRDIAGQLNELGVLTARGGRWHPSTVNSILARLEEAA
jgi:DNA invertase Pin-like site-specific DNA recombinase